jgi:hypothetical protein
MHKVKPWEKIFQGKYPKKRVKMLDAFMGPLFQTKGKCWEGCKFGITHLPAGEIPNDKREEYKAYTVCMRSTQIPK